MRVLVCEDEPAIADAVARGLRRHGAEVEVAADGGTALARARAGGYDVVVLDRALPVVHGDDVCRALNAEHPDTKILMLTASAELDAMVEGLGLGADDYLGKPFLFAELVARITALARRSEPAVPAVLRCGDVELSTARRTVTRAGRPVDLSPKELAVLELLLVADGAVVSAEELLERAWDSTVDPFSNIVRMTVMKLRRKLGEPPVVHTLPGAGYCVRPVVTGS